jgi:plasmid maintenance system killer protein
MEYVGKRLDLSKAEADKFWPVYNEYNDKIKVLRKNFRQSFKKPVDALSDKEIEELYLLDLQTKQAEAELYKVYRDKLKLIIGAKRMLKLIAAENDFKKEVIKTIQDKSD